MKYEKGLTRLFVNILAVSSCLGCVAGYLITNGSSDLIVGNISGIFIYAIGLNIILE